jgi:hypothetical protein
VFGNTEKLSKIRLWLKDKGWFAGFCALYTGTIKDFAFINDIFTFLR